jgi:uncharacterized membrane protein
VEARGAHRIAAIDLLRGAVMVLMAVDHVRVYAGVPAGGPHPGVFFTRWITHFCAPVFVFLAGASAYFYGRRHPGLSRFLLVRGLWLVVLELTVLRVAWTFNFRFHEYLLAGVIWVIGWSLIVMAGLVRFPLRAVAAFGLVMIFGHNLLDGPLRDVLQAEDAPVPWLWKILYVGFFAGPVSIGPDGPPLHVLYSLVPWVGVMAAGFAMGRVLELDPQRRDRACVAFGLSAIGLFLLLRGFNLYGDLRPWSAPAANGSSGSQMPALLSFLNTTKYPASLDFLLMTLGPAIAVIPLLERAHGAWFGWLTVFGRVPFFYYVLHIPWIHALALLVSVVRQGHVDAWLFANHPMGNPPPPEGYRWSLPLLYGVWAVAVVALFVPCRWFAGVKARGPSILRYL